jgi:hypothetical protein
MERFRGSAFPFWNQSRKQLLPVGTRKLFDANGVVKKFR